MSWTQTKNMAPFLSPTPLRPKSMLYDEFSAGNRGLLKHPAKVISRPCLSAAPGADASAIHGRLSAQVALLQSPTLPAAKSGYSQNREFRNVPVDKPHTRIPRFISFLKILLRLRTISTIAVRRREEGAGKRQVPGGFGFTCQVKVSDFGEMASIALFSAFASSCLRCSTAASRLTASKAQQLGLVNDLHASASRHCHRALPGVSLSPLAGRGSGRDG